MIIDTTYFILPPLQIPNAVAQPSIGLNTPNNVQKLQAVIDRVEYIFLWNLLGYEQYTELKAQFNPDGTWIAEPLEKWVDLVDGKDSWPGLRYEVGDNKVSLIAYYVYHEFLKNDRQYYSSTGLVAAEAANAVKTSVSEELTEKWNDFVIQYQGCDNYNYFRDWWHGWWYSQPITENYISLYDYMQSNDAVYDVSFMKLYSVKNRFGL